MATEAKVVSPNKVNPFANIQSADLQKYAGSVIAVDMATQKILESAPTAKDLREKMKQSHLGVKYGRLALPKVPAPV